MEEKMTLREIYEHYVQYRVERGKTITKDSFQTIKSLIYFIENRKHTGYLTQRLFNEWLKDKRRTYNALTVVNAFITYANEQGYIDIESSKPVYIGHPLKKLFDQPLKKSVVSDMMTKFIEWKTKTIPLNNNYHYILIRFNNYCATNFPDAKELTQEMIDGWCEMNENEIAKTRNGRVYPIARFVDYAQAKGWNKIRRPSMLPEKPNIGRSGNHIFTKRELTDFFRLTNEIVRSSYEFVHDFKRRRLVVSVIFRLLYSTGMRLTDVLRLKRNDVDLDKGIISFYGYNNPNSKTRIAISYSLLDLLRKYDDAMDKFFPDRNIYFPNRKAKQLSKSAINKNFKKLWSQVSDTYACISDFRVTFAVENINKWDYDGTDWNIDLVHLSKAMGHVNTLITENYLTLVPRYQRLLAESSGKNLQNLIPDLDEFTDNEKEN